MNLSPRQKWMIPAVGALLIAGIILLVTFWPSFFEKAVEFSKIIQQEKVRSSLDGLLKNPEGLDGRIYAVMIDNHSFGRPYHSGLSSASVFYEALAEGGITRIMALFEGPVLSRVGPARSLRPYFLDFSVPYAPVLIHVGGSDEALAQVRRQSQIFDVDGMPYEGIKDYFVRDPKIDMPHNDFANLKAIAQLATEKSFATSAKDSLFEFSSSVPEGETEAREIELGFSFPQYKVKFVFDSTLGFYRRFIGGQPHKDAASQSQLTAANIIVLFTSYFPIDEIGRLKMKTTGSGKAFFFRDGKKFEGTWQREAGKQLQLLGSDGKTWKLKPGSTWIEVLDDPNKVNVLSSL